MKCILKCRKIEYFESSEETVEDLESKVHAVDLSEQDDSDGETAQVNGGVRPVVQRQGSPDAVEDLDDLAVTSMILTYCYLYHAISAQSTVSDVEKLD